MENEKKNIFEVDALNHTRFFNRIETLLVHGLSINPSSNWRMKE